MIIIPQTFRGIAFIGIFMMIASIAFTRMNSKEKTEYISLKGQIIYLDQTMGTLPTRDKGSYRYLIIDSYQFPFEIYADKQARIVDSLAIGDHITVYFYETGNTHSEKLNRYLQFLEKDGIIYFKRTGFQRTMGFIMIGMSLGLVLFGYALWKTNKIGY
ncbi:hypothetical protein [Dyadobacter aurulentus]|uniref:hypothetical protein n=1 Tax=Dyadobacter sp. UC 10 TaxID=2605428 RepID=UPI0011F3B261|nr:hypothetical protein [Dyadobacter sp. UC 10]KAA0992685.1 hypothetical protein FXO21_22175 [Dyadobacter sp. UC 10]